MSGIFDDLNLGNGPRGDVCSCSKIVCPNLCGINFNGRAEAESHVRECNMILAKCFKGCQREITRAEMKNHDCAKDKKLQELEKAVDLLRKKSDKLERENTTLKNQNT